MSSSSSSSSLYPEKIAMYFSSMNPLSAKIYADVKAVEETVSMDENLSFSEKSKIIDKHLIYDVIRRNKRKQHQQKQIPLKSTSTGSEEEEEEDDDQDVPLDQVYFDDQELDKDHVAALLSSVYPKKPEKYIYDDNSFYLDEHSEPFSYCSQSQAGFCDLEKQMRSLPSGSLPFIHNINNNNNKQGLVDSRARTAGNVGAPHHHPHPHHREKKPAPSLPIRRLSEEVGYSSSNESINNNSPMPTHSHKPTPAPKKTGVPLLGVPVLGGLAPAPAPRTINKVEDPGKNANKPAVDEANLPKQVQNSDLIAELQQKLKMNKGKGASLKHTPSIKLNKPKAPPPPPPKQAPGTAVKVTEPLQGSRPPQQQQQPSSSLTAEPPSKKTGEKNNKKEQQPQQPEDFSVDVSSPCRIATPKTGFDFLDNW